MLAAVRTAARSTATTSQRIDAPLGSPAGKALWGGSSVWMFVPVAAELEKRAIAWLTDRSDHRRVEAVEALGHFRSTDNIARITKLLADPASMVNTDSNGRSEKRYAVREAAHHVLVKWGVAHTTPTLAEPVAKP